MDFTDFQFFLGFLSSLASGIGLLFLMPPKDFRWGRGLHIFVALSQFWTAIIYFMVLSDFLSPLTYAKFLYPVSVLILAPGWVVWLTKTVTYKRLWK